MIRTSDKNKVTINSSHVARVGRLDKSFIPKETWQNMDAKSPGSILPDIRNSKATYLWEGIRNMTYWWKNLKSYQCMRNLPIINTILYEPSTRNLEVYEVYSSYVDCMFQWLEAQMLQDSDLRGYGYEQFDEENMRCKCKQ